MCHQRSKDIDDNDGQQAGGGDLITMGQHFEEGCIEMCDVCKSRAFMRIMRALWRDNDKNEFCDFVFEHVRVVLSFVE